jgi:hypothetical protein
MEEQQITPPPVSPSEPQPETPELEKPYFGHERQIAYTITDAYFPDFSVYESANAWWMDRGKVERLIAAYKMGALVDQARVYAGVSEGQYKYFLEIHPEFSTIKAACREVPLLRSLQTVEKDIENPTTAKWFLEKRHPLFGNRVKVEADEPLVHNTNINVNDGTDSGKVEEAVARVLARVGLDRPGPGDSSQSDAGQPEEVHPE